MPLKSAEDIFAEAKADLVSSMSELQLATHPQELDVQATTCVGLVFNEGVVVGADGQATAMPTRIVTSSFKKILPLDSHSLLAIAGVPGIAIRMAKLLRAQFSFDADLYEGRYIPPRSKMNIIANMIQKNMGMAFSHGLIVVPIFTTFDQDPREPGGRVFSISPDGSDLPEVGLEAIGSGGDSAKLSIRVLLRVGGKNPRNLSLDEAQRLVIQGLLDAHEVDAGTGENLSMSYITKEGISIVSKDQVSLLKTSIAEGRKI